MPKAKSLNLELRSFVLQHAIRQEALTAEILKYIFKILKADPKTFGDTGSSVSFQTKIDFLYDLEEISKKDYPHFRKLLEIRNQFAHILTCCSFTDLSKTKKTYTDYILNHFPNNESDLEKKLLNSYISLFKHCHRVLYSIKKSYFERFLVEMQRYQAYTLLETKFQEWVSLAKEDFEKNWLTYEMDNWPVKPDKISVFILSLDSIKQKIFHELIVNETIPSKLVKAILNKQNYE